MTSQTQQLPPILDIRSPGTPSIYVEGLSQFLIGFPNSRMTLYSLAEPGVPGQTAPQKRHIACELIMPTSSVVEVAQILINTLAANKSTINAAKEDWLRKLEALSDSLKSIDSPVMLGQPTQEESNTATVT